MEENVCSEPYDGLLLLHLQEQLFQQNYVLPTPCERANFEEEFADCGQEFLCSLERAGQQALQQVELALLDAETLFEIKRENSAQGGVASAASAKSACQTLGLTQEHEARERIRKTLLQIPCKIKVLNEARAVSRDWSFFPSSAENFQNCLRALAATKNISSAFVHLILLHPLTKIKRHKKQACAVLNFFLYKALCADDVAALKEILFGFVNTQASFVQSRPYYFDFNALRNSLLDCGKCTLLVDACVQDSAACVEFLLSQNMVDVNVRCAQGKTALHWAASKGSARSVALLVKQKNVNINAKDFTKKQLTPLLCALHALGRKKNVGALFNCIEALLDCGQNLNANCRDMQSKKSAMWHMLKHQITDKAPEDISDADFVAEAAQHSPFPVRGLFPLRLYQKMLGIPNFQINAFMCPYSQHTPISMSMEWNNDLSFFAALEHPKCYTKFALMLAVCRRFRKEFIAALLNKSNDSKAILSNCLHRFCRSSAFKNDTSDFEEIVDLFLKKGAQIKDDVLPWMLCKYTYSTTSGNFSLYVARKDNSGFFVRALLVRGANPNARVAVMDTPLVAASENKHAVEALSELVRWPATDINSTNNKYGKCALTLLIHISRAQNAVDLLFRRDDLDLGIFDKDGIAAITHCLGHCLGQRPECFAVLANLPSNLAEKVSSRTLLTQVFCIHKVLLQTRKIENRFLFIAKCYFVYALIILLVFPVFIIREIVWLTQNCYEAMVQLGVRVAAGIRNCLHCGQRPEHQPLLTCAHNCV